MSTGGAFQAPGVTLISYKGDIISRYVCPTAIIDIAQNLSIFNFDA